MLLKLLAIWSLAGPALMLASRPPSTLVLLIRKEAVEHDFCAASKLTFNQMMDYEDCQSEFEVEVSCLCRYVCVLWAPISSSSFTMGPSPSSLFLFFLVHVYL